MLFAIESITANLFYTIIAIIVNAIYGNNDCVERNLHFGYKS